MDKERKKIYTITVMEKLEEDEKTKFPDFGSSFIPGWYSKMSDAFDAVKDNACDINEAGCYDYAIIEEVEEGLYQPGDKEHRWLFKYNKEKDSYEQIEEPEFLKHFCGFSMN